jgi:hypothetical protein
MLLADLTFPEIPLSAVLIGACIVVAAIVIINAVIVVPTNYKVRAGARRGIFSQLLYVVFLALIAVLAVTSFGSILQYGHLSGYALLAHIGAAGAFVFLLVAIAWLYLPRGYGAPLSAKRGEDRWWLARWSAWILIVSSIASAATMFASMLPLLDTEGLLEFAAWHRYVGVLVVMAAIVHLYAMLCTRLGWR